MWTAKRRKGGHWPYKIRLRQRTVSPMTFFLDYEAEGHTFGHVQIPRVSSEEAFIYAKDALRGMNCLKAVLRCSETIWEFKGDFDTVARYTHAKGWER